MKNMFVEEIVKSVCGGGGRQRNKEQGRETLMIYSKGGLFAMIQLIQIYQNLPCKFGHFSSQKGVLH